MPKGVMVDKEAFERVLKKMIGTKTTPKASLPKSQKKLGKIIEPAR
ncbi:MAG: hypothetical protein ACRD2G_05800 [Terriglobia bacterium]